MQNANAPHEKKHHHHHQRTASELAEREYTRKFSRERLFIRSLVRHSYFSTFIYLVIGVNTVLIAFDDISADRDNTFWIVSVSVYSDWAILAIFTAEMFLKMIAFGIGYKPPLEPEVEPELAGYFAGAWNRLDSFIVLMSWILVPVAAISGSDIEKLVRVLRLARPLRLLRELKNLQALNELVQTVPVALASFVDVTGFLIFTLLIFSILALNIWGLEGKFHGRCVVNSNEKSLSLDTRGLLQVPRTLCGAGGNQCSEGFMCSCAPAVMEDGTIERRPYAYSNPLNGDPGCLFQGTKRPWEEGLQSDEPMCPEAGYTCFNSFPLAMFTTFKAATLESWSVVMWYAMDIGSPTVGWIFFILLVSVVSFNIMNLYVASMSSAYLEVQTRNKDLEKIAQIERKMEQHKMEAIEAKRRQQGDEADDESFADGSHSESEGDDEGDGDGQQGGKKKKGSWGDVIFDPNTYWMTFVPHDRPLNPIAQSLRTVMSYPQIVDECGTPVPGVIIDIAKARNLQVNFGPRYAQFSVFAIGAGAQRQSFDSKLGTPCTEEYLPGQVVVPLEPPSYASVPDRQELKDLLMTFTSTEARDPYAARGITVEKPEPVPHLDMLILLCILCNAASSCMEHFGGYPVEVDQDVIVAQGSHCCDEKCLVTSSERCPRGLVRMAPEWYEFMFVIELIFNAIFTVELLCRIISWWSFTKYLSYNYPSNLIDFIIVVTSDLMFLLEFFTSGLFNASILRLTRLVRVVRAFKTAASMRRLQAILVKAAKAMNVCCYVFGLLLLWHAASALLGMQLFRCKVEDPVKCKRANETSSCPFFCPDLLGDPPTCKFSEQGTFDHCPWEEKRNLNTFFQAIMLLFYVTTGDTTWTGDLNTKP